MTRRKHGAATVRIGTSGWHYAHWKGPFYPASMPNHQFLSFYTTHYTTVELNNPFYRIPTEKTFAAWRENTPSGFLFAVKANLRFTHIKNFKDPHPDLSDFLQRVDALHEIIEIGLGVLQFFDVGETAVGLEREEKTARRILAPRR